jgi:hypothetical protein
MEAKELKHYLLSALNTPSFVPKAFLLSLEKSLEKAKNLSKSDLF